jgi:hypothetical protein
MRADQAARARHGTRGGACAPRRDGILREVEQDEKVIDRIAAAQREELEQEIAELAKEARAREEEIEELVGSLLF